MTRVSDLLDALATYRSARKALLRAIGVETSNRDPLAEFAERLVATLFDGTVATSRVQAHWDVRTGDGSTIQVKYLSNALGEGGWVNEHRVHRLPGVNFYAVVLIEDFSVVGVLAFPPDLTFICAALDKRHPRQDEQLLMTRRDWLAIAADPDRFETLGMRVWLLDDLPAQ